MEDLLRHLKRPEMFVESELALIQCTNLSGQPGDVLPIDSFTHDRTYSVMTISTSRVSITAIMGEWGLSIFLDDRSLGASRQPDRPNRARKQSIGFHEYLLLQPGWRSPVVCSGPRTAVEKWSARAAPLIVRLLGTENRRWDDQSLPSTLTPPKTDSAANHVVPEVEL